MAKKKSTGRKKTTAKRKTGARKKRAARASAAPAAGFGGEPELIVMSRREAQVRVEPTGLASLSAADVSPLEKVAKKWKLRYVPLFGVSEERLANETVDLSSAAGAPMPDLSVYYRVETDAPAERLGEIADDLLEADVVEAAYVKPPSEPPQVNDMVAAPDEAPPVSPDFTARQIYLNPAPAGIDARFAWTLAGGRGQDVRIIDIEGAWRFSHEDLTQNQGGVIGGVQSTDIRWRNHGTAVIGVFGADQNGFGCTGIAPEANTRAVSIFGGVGSAAAIRQSANALRAGDIILIELHRPGPRHSFLSRDDQLGYIAIEWWPDDFDAIQFAVGRGVIVVEAAGNGAENLDDALYNTPHPGFPAGWTNPFNRSNRDSGAIVVGAGAPPPGTHGRNHGTDRSRLGFSNWGALIDAQGWGREVTTCGYGSLQGGVNEDLWYTDTFSGTSSASPCVVGALACVQGRLRALNRAPMTPAEARRCLRTTGSPQQDTPGRPRTQRIGNRPDLRELIRCATGVVKVKEVKEPKEIKELKEPKELKELRKEFKDLKDRRKEFKERFKEIFDKGFEKRLDKRFEKGFERPEGAAAAEGGLEERVAALEETLAELAHFIGPEMRPDLGTSALSDEGDLQSELEKQATDGKQTKDSSEKPREY